jgi:hypothetical protein
MNIFDYLNDILFTKRGNSLQNVDEESNFNMYMLNRWISMYSPNLAIVINSTTNWMHSVFETKQQYYQFVSKVLPKVNRKRIHYIKKTKKEPTEQQEDNNKLMAKRLELSEREIKSYYELLKCCTSRASGP